MQAILVGEALGSFLLFACVVGSGVMAQALAGGNVAVALIGNVGAIAALLYVLITMLGPVSGAHFNPAVTMITRLRGEGSWASGLAMMAVQLVAGVAGVWCAHAMFDLPILQFSDHARTGPGQWLGEFIATFGLLLTVLLTGRHRPDAMPGCVALYITAACWFTSSTSFANPTLTFARSLTDTFDGIAMADVPAFILAQLAGALCAHWLDRAMHPAA
ncbi:aquaporin [Sandarakinorhabdus sp.]|uniref:aquaporin n=1 Tax=Sandarakinorhabdus sp. TaxID=1916663 RepID=UPI00286E7E7F|nr:aquaporin [Sandarakinorhabdus sp.]